MANLSITTICNKNCTYCFANDAKDQYGNMHMDDIVYKKALDYICRSGLDQVRIMGGEPTLHPNFIQMISYALEQDLKIMLFTNGLISDKILNFLTDIPEHRLSILLNTIHPKEGNPVGMSRQQEVMKSLNRSIIPGVNIYSPGQKLDYLIDYVVRYNLKKEIRFGICHSVLSQNNIFLHPKEYPKIGHHITLLKYEAMDSGISLGFDCGFTPCMFPENSLDLLSEELKKAGTCCHPIIDMLPDGTFISCYPLHNLHKIKLRDDLVANELIRDFENGLSPYKGIGIYPHCTICPLFNKRCNGGCMSFRIQRYLQ